MAGHELWPLLWKGRSCPCMGNLKFKDRPYREGLFSTNCPDPGLISFTHKGLLQVIKRNHEHAIEKRVQDVKGTHQRNTQGTLFSFILIF